MAVANWCKDTRLKAVGKRFKETGHLHHSYKCVVCGEMYRWGQQTALLCDKCETLFVPYIDQSIYDEAYAKKYAQYEKTEINTLLQEIRWDTIFTYRSNGKVLDYGCGTGAFLKAGPDWSACGTDINECALEYCKKDGIKTLPLHEALKEKWDVITMFDVLEHLPELSILNDIHDALKDSKDEHGILVIATPNFTKNTNLKEWRHYRPQGEHTFGFSQKSIETIAEIYDFKILEVNDNESKARPPKDNIATYVLAKK